MSVSFLIFSCSHLLPPRDSDSIVSISAKILFCFNNSVHFKTFVRSGKRIPATSNVEFIVTTLNSLQLLTIVTKNSIYNAEGPLNCFWSQYVTTYLNMFSCWNSYLLNFMFNSLLNFIFNSKKPSLDGFFRLLLFTTTLLRHYLMDLDFFEKNTKRFYCRIKFSLCYKIVNFHSINVT